MVRDYHAREADMNEDWPRILDTYDIQVLVLDPRSDRDLLECFRLHPGWAIESQDADMVLFVRADIASTQDTDTCARDDIHTVVSRSSVGLARW